MVTIPETQGLQKTSDFKNNKTKQKWQSHLAIYTAENKTEKILKWPEKKDTLPREKSNKNRFLSNDHISKSKEWST